VGWLDVAHRSGGGRIRTTPAVRANCTHLICSLNKCSPDQSIDRVLASPPLVLSRSTCVYHVTIGVHQHHRPRSVVEYRYALRGGHRYQPRQRRDRLGRKTPCDPSTSDQPSYARVQELARSRVDFQSLRLLDVFGTWDDRPVFHRRRFTAGASRVSLSRQGRTAVIVSSRSAKSTPTQRVCRSSPGWPSKTFGHVGPIPFDVFECDLYC